MLCQESMTLATYTYMVLVGSHRGTDHLAWLRLLFCLQMRQSIFVTYSK